MTSTHGHGHGHGHEPDWGQMAAMLEAEAETRRQFLDDAARWIAGLHSGGEIGRVVDIGAGPGVASEVFAAAFPTAQVLAADGERVLLDRAAERAAAAGIADRISTRRVDLATDDLPAVLDEADVVWAGQVLHHLPDQREAVRRVAALLRPGGVLALVEGGLPARTLPRDIGLGRPGLAARLAAAWEDWFTAMRDETGGPATVEHWPTMLTDAGLVEPRTRSFLVDHPPPLDDAPRRYVRTRLARQRDTLGEHLDASDRAVLDRLLDPDDPAGIEHRDDVFLLAAHTVHTARRSPTAVQEEQLDAAYAAAVAQNPNFPYESADERARSRARRNAREARV